MTYGIGMEMRNTDTGGVSHRGVRKGTNAV